MPIGKTKMNKVDGGELHVDFSTENIKTQDFDEYIGEPLPKDLGQSGDDGGDVVLQREDCLDRSRRHGHEGHERPNLFAHAMGPV